MTHSNSRQEGLGVRLRINHEPIFSPAAPQSPEGNSGRLRRASGRQASSTYSLPAVGAFAEGDPGRPGVHGPGEYGTIIWITDCNVVGAPRDSYGFTSMKLE